MPGFSDYKNALAMRDLLQRLSAEEIAKQRPAYKYAEVVSVNTSTRTANVLIPGDPSEVTIPYGLIAVPEGAGQIVRIDGLLGDRFISDVLTPYVAPLDTMHYVGDPGEPAFQNSWVNYGTTDWVNASFYKDPEGIVHIQGMVKNGTTATASIFSLPVGYRPSRTIHYIAHNNGGFAYAAVLSDGQVKIANDSLSPSTVWINLACSFVAEDVNLGDDLESNWIPLPEDPATAWTWNNAGTLDPYTVPAMWRRSDGLILLRGAIHGAAGANVTSHLVPAEYLPHKAILIPTLGRTAATASQIALRLDINPNSKVSPQTAVNNFFLDNVKFFDKQKTADWVGFTDLLINSWTSYKTLDSQGRMQQRFHQPAYYKDKYNRVWMRGMIAGGTMTSGTNLLTLPAGFRPGHRQMHLVKTGTSAGTGRLDIQANGIVSIQSTNDAMTNTFLSFDGVSFLAEN